MLRRHDLLRPGPDAWDIMLRSRPELAAVALVAEWARLRRPVIVRRRMPDDRPDDVPAALPLPPDHGKRRVALTFPADLPMTALPPVLLRHAAAAAPPHWRPVISALVAVGDEAGIAPRVFGAMMWQHATGLPYLTARSDLDLLWPVGDEATARSLGMALTRLHAAGPVRIDGEFVLPDGAGVNWREFAEGRGAAATILAKTVDGVEMLPRAALFRKPVPA